MQMKDTFEELMFFYWFRKNILGDHRVDDEVYIHYVQYRNKLQTLGEVKGDITS